MSSWPKDLMMLVILLERKISNAKNGGGLALAKLKDANIDQMGPDYPMKESTHVPDFHPWNSEVFNLLFYPVELLELLLSSSQFSQLSLNWCYPCPTQAIDEIFLDLDALRKRMFGVWKEWHAVASWTWNAQDETCGICRMAFDGCCPDCKLPGDDCPLIWGACNHAFHLHCILKWVNSQTSQAHCPMCRREWQFKG
ncbi:hypothetical protein Csa_016037 [Cucumis sativus]|uniref:Anaphase-promoting complex subunit 11 n=2 Tax=Cucumis sativus TaxID=3659 RepID=A0A0A0K9J6_CUCSA|nr:hypothetical protein Csa_016037 [Cucumis sativus]